MIINVRDYVAAEKEKLKQVIKDNNLQPSLMIIQVGDNSASNSYVKGKIKDCEEVGIEATLEKHEEDWFYQNGNLSELQETILKYDGIIVQLPIENHLLKQEIYDMISPLQDVDGLIYIKTNKEHKDGEIINVKIVGNMIHDLIGEEI